MQPKLKLTDHSVYYKHIQHHRALQTDTSWRANKKNVSKSGGQKKETLEFWEEQLRANLRFFFGAGGQERSSGIRNFCPLGVEQMLLDLSVSRPASIAGLGEVEMVNWFDDSLLLFDRRRRFLYWVLLLFLPAGAIEEILGLVLWYSWWRNATKETLLETDSLVYLSS